MSDVPPGSDGPFGSETPPTDSGAEAIKARVRGPAILLLIVNALNLLVGIYLLTDAFAVKSDPADADAEMAKQWDIYTPEQKAMLEKWGWTPQKVVTVFSNIFLWLGGFSVIVGVVGILGGRRMLSLRSHGIGVTGAILTAIPFASPCCLLGQVAGVWALIVLLNKDVRSAFH